MLKEDNRKLMLEKAIKDHQYQASALLEILHKAQELYGYLNREILSFVASSLKLPPSHVYGVAAFYNYFRLKQPGEHVVTTCMGTACYVKGAEDIISAVEKEFNVKRGDSTADGKLSIFTTRCIGACAMAPSIVIDDEVVGKATKEIVIEKIKLLLGGKKTETS
ncbi:MAG: NAD(P)H-dependent oxidoreductase subunit E [Candidatus Bathyarchaeota archaeon]|nr:NAD(P)H-dependent oxidoreductase subunit E [Candidatus Bathyarchaeota archaeon]